MKQSSYRQFRQNYENNISKKLEIDKEEFYVKYYQAKPPLVAAIFGGFLLIYALYIIFRVSLLYGLVILSISLFIIYTRFKKQKLAFKISKNGIWSGEYGFIYFRHIDRFEFYRYIGIHSSERLKIYIKNFELYNMDKPFLEQPISHIHNYGDLQSNLNKALKSTY